MEFRAYAAGDAEATLAIFLRAVRETARAHYSPEQVAAWAAGLGHHDPRFLLLAPLPLALALSAGYAGVMNASGALRYEGAIAVAESALIVSLVLVRGDTELGRLEGRATGRQIERLIRPHVAAKSSR